MSIRNRTVRVLQVSNRVSARTGHYLPNFQKYAEPGRPRLVLDCSKVWNMNAATIRLLLSCLEEVMKYNGDVRLASLCPEAEAALRMAGINRLFELYATTEDAIQSFHKRPSSMMPLAFENEAFDNDVEYAA